MRVNTTMTHVTLYNCSGGVTDSGIHQLLLTLNFEHAWQTPVAPARPTRPLVEWGPTLYRALR